MTCSYPGFHQETPGIPSLQVLISANSISSFLTSGLCRLKGEAQGRPGPPKPTDPPSTRAGPGNPQHPQEDPPKTSSNKQKVSLGKLVLLFGSCFLEHDPSLALFEESDELRTKRSRSLLPNACFTQLTLPLFFSRLS